MRALPEVNSKTRQNHATVAQVGRLRLAVMTGVLLLIFASRVWGLAGVETDRDELLSIYRTFGDPLQIIRWSPDDWPPLYFLLLAGWKEVAGIFPFALRMLSVLVGMFGYAFMYRLVKRLHGWRAGLLATLAYAGFGYSMFININLRGYAIVHALLPLVLWLTVRYFDRSTLRRAVPLAVTIAAMFYTTLVSAPAYGLVGLYSLALFGRKVWRWWLPVSIAALLMLPEFINKLDIIGDRSGANEPLLPFTQVMTGLYAGYVGAYDVAWWLLIGLATVLLLRRQRNLPRLGVFVVWIGVFPALMYFLLDPLFTDTPRYSFWALTGLALLLGWGLSRLPRPAVGGLSLLLALFLFAPRHTPSYFVFPYTDTFSWLTDHVRTGDVLLQDPNCSCPETAEWRYYTRLYFPDTGLQFVTEPGEHRRVWYITGKNDPDSGLLEVVRSGRADGVRYGQENLMFHLYESPPDPRGVLFENGMRFHGVEVIDDDVPWFGETVRYEGETLRFRLWWSVDAPVAADYSIATYLIRRGRIRVQFDGPPQVVDPNLPRATSQWLPGRYYVEERSLLLPYTDNTRPRGYRVDMTVYEWWEGGQRIPAPGVDEDNLLTVLELTIRSN